jgi:dihydropteroate synthase
MGIINVTARFVFTAAAANPLLTRLLQKAEQMINEGLQRFLISADKATRPNSKQISAEEEAERVCACNRSGT